MISTFIKSLIGAVLAITMLCSKATAFDIGSVWGVASTDTTIQVDCKISEKKFTTTTTPTYEVCWRLKSDWWKGVCNGGSSVTTTTMPYTISGLSADTEYKIRINVLCYKNNKHLEMRNINETTCSTASAATATPGTGTISVVPTDTSLAVTVTWTGGTGSSGPQWIRIGYKKKTNFFYDLEGTLEDESQTLPGNWDPGNWVKGACQITKPNVAATNTHTFTGLKQCREYDVEATVYNPDGGSLTALEIARTKVKTTGNCGFGTFKTDPMFDDEDDIGSGYVDAVNDFYAPSFVPVTHVVGVVPVGNFAIACDHPAGSSTMKLQSLATAAPTSMHAVATTTVPSSSTFQTIHFGDLGGTNQIVVMEDRWDVYGFANALQPQRLGGLMGIAAGRDVATRGTTGYVSMGAAGLAVVDASNPAVPTLANVVSGLGSVEDACTAGNNLFVAVQELGVLAFDVTNPLSPNLTGLYTPGYANNASAVACDSAHIYVANDAGLEVIDALTLTRVGVKSGLSGVSSIQVGGTSAFIGGILHDGVSVYSGILRFSVAIPTNPQLTGSYTPHAGLVGLNLRSFALQGNRIFAALDVAGCSIIDAQTMLPASESELGRWSPGTSPLLAHIAATDPTLATAITASEHSGQTSINDQDLFKWLFEDNRKSCDAWQADSALHSAGLDLEAWMQSNHPTEWAQYLSELGPVGFEGFNVDLGDSSSPPPGSYDGSGLHAGVWNAVSAPWSGPLVDVNGRASTTTASGSAASAFSFDNPETIDEEQALFDDGQLIGPLGSSVTWTFTNMMPGDYRVTTNAWNPSDSNALVGVDVVGSPDGVKVCGGSWPDVDVEGINFVQHGITILGSTLVLHATTQSGVGVLNGFQLERLYPPFFGVPYCFGNSPTTSCPCGNNGGPNRGCENSAGTGGALLSATGTTNPDALLFTSSGELPSALSILLQGSANIPTGVVFGDGVRCAGGSLKRLYVKHASGGIVNAPEMGDLPITTRSASLGDPITLGSIRYYQVYYRDPNLAFCPSPAGGSFNISSAMEIIW